mmetsp:Transcript_19908/g.50224  ORF Transcript_19908/g.50224 Transcript_19908/m.50224 type:complete len:415 (+) Transcript_19908:513-1757(+)
MPHRSTWKSVEVNGKEQQKRRIIFRSRLHRVFVAPAHPGHGPQHFFFLDLPFFEGAERTHRPGHVGGQSVFVRLAGVAARPLFAAADLVAVAADVVLAPLRHLEPVVQQIAVHVAVVLGVAAVRLHRGWPHYVHVALRHVVQLRQQHVWVLVPELLRVLVHHHDLRARAQALVVQVSPWRHQVRWRPPVGAHAALADLAHAPVAARVRLPVLAAETPPAEVGAGPGPVVAVGVTRLVLVLHRHLRRLHGAHHAHGLAVAADLAVAVVAGLALLATNAVPAELRTGTGSVVALLQAGLVLVSQGGRRRLVDRLNVEITVQRDVLLGEGLRAVKVDLLQVHAAIVATKVAVGALSLVDAPPELFGAAKVAARTDERGAGIPGLEETCGFCWEEVGVVARAYPARGTLVVIAHAAAV